MSVNAEIRRAIRVELARRGLKQKDLSEMTEISPQHISQLMSGKSGNLAKGWDAILSALDLQLIAVPKDPNDENQ
jgi:transcriptional regulator with XRE-family HTH domain